MRLEDVGRGFAVPAGAGAIAAARRGELIVEVNGAGLAPFAWRGAAAVALLPFLCGFEEGTACGIWSFVLAAELCNGVDDDCDTVVDDGELCADNLPCTVDTCGGAAGCQHASSCQPGSTCCMDGCADLQNDPQHCSSCSVVCAFAHATPSCTGAICGIASLPDRLGQLRRAGDERVRDQHHEHGPALRGLGTVCAFANANAACAASMCGIASCWAGWATATDR